MRASSCSLPSRDSFLLMKSFSVALCCTLNSLHVSSIPLWSSFTSLSTFSRLTGRMEKGPEERKVRSKKRRGMDRRLRRLRSGVEEGEGRLEQDEEYMVQEGCHEGEREGEDWKEEQKKEEKEEKDD